MIAPQKTNFGGRNKLTVGDSTKKYRNKVVGIRMLHHFLFKTKPCKTNNNVTREPKRSK